MADPNETLAKAIAQYMADIEPVEQWPQGEDTLLDDFKDALEEDVWDLALKEMAKIRYDNTKGRNQYVEREVVALYVE